MGSNSTPDFLAYSQFLRSTHRALSATAQRLVVSDAKFLCVHNSIFPNNMLSLLFPGEARRSMQQTPEPRRRLNVLTKAERRQRIFARCARAGPMTRSPATSGLSPERIRQIVAEVLGKRVIDRGPHHAHLQLERLMPALAARGRGDRARRHQGDRAADQGDRPDGQASGDGRGEALLRAGGAAAPARQDQPRRRESQPTANPRRRLRRQERTKQTPPNFPRNPLKSLVSDERFQGNPRPAAPRR